MYSANRTYREQTLPGVVQEYLRRVLGESMALPQRQYLEQVGDLRFALSNRWRSFHATEHRDLVDIAFRWSARMRLAPMTWIDAVDERQGEHGSSSHRLWGRFPMQTTEGDDIAVSHAMRYLAELPWSPHAMVSNTKLRWREIAENRIEVSTRVCETRICVRFGFNGAGNPVAAYIPDRPCVMNGRTFRSPWQGIYGDFRTVCGIWMPTTAENSWQLPGGPFEYWRGTVTGVDLG